MEHSKQLPNITAVISLMATDNLDILSIVVSPLETNPILVIYSYVDMENGRRPIGKENAGKLAKFLNADYRMLL